VIDWAEKYRPRSLKDIVGNKSAIEELKKWADSWERGNVEYKGVILVGDPGVGKTSSALALARDYNWAVIELNASDIRNESAIRRIVLAGATNETFTSTGQFISSRSGGRKLIILDEADNLYETFSKSSDRGGKRAIVEALRETSQPIILIVNDYYSLIKGASGGKIKKMCKVIKFKAPRSTQIRAVLRKICAAEGVRASDEVLDYIAKRAEGDVRSAINDLQAIAEGKDVITMEDVKALGYRDRKEEIFRVLAKIFKSTEINSARRAAMEVDESPDHLLLWIDENLPYEYTDPHDCSRAYWVLSKADVFLGRVIRRQHYRLWGYATTLMTGGVAVSKARRYKTFVRYKFPTWLMKMSASKESRKVLKSIAEKIAEHCHMSRRAVLDEFLHYFAVLYRENEKFRIDITRKLELTENEIAYLLGDKASESAVKAVLEAAKARAEEIEKIVERDAHEGQRTNGCF